MSRKAKYSNEFKLEVVERYLNGEGSYDDLAIKYENRAMSVVRKWVLKYN